MSSKLSSSFTSASTRTSFTSASTRTPRASWNLATSLPSDQSDTTRMTYQRQHRGSIAWSLTSSDRDGTAEGMISDQDIKLSILNACSSGASNSRGNGTDVATLSSSYSGCGEVPIRIRRITREDNVNIEKS